MNIAKVLVAVLTLTSVDLARAEDNPSPRPGKQPAIEAATPPSSLMEMLSACPTARQPDGWGVMWHPSLPGLDPLESERVFKYLEAPDFDDCLRLMIESEPMSHKLVLRLKD